MEASKANPNEVETGIYVVCSDRMLLSTINTMLRRKGIIGVADAEGKMHYFVDARKNPGIAARQINNILFGGKEIEEESEEELSASYQIPQQVVNAIVDEILVSYGFDLALMGTKAMRVIIMKLAVRDQVGRLTTKQLFNMAAETLDIRYEHVERNIRYAISKSSFDYEGKKSMTIMKDLALEVRKRITRFSHKK